MIEKLIESSKGLLKKGSDPSLQYSRIPFNIAVLDKLTGGGIPQKRMTLLTGATNVGKSYLASQIVSCAQKQGLMAAWIDTELSWDPSWMAKCGIDTDAILVSQPLTGEAAFDLMRALMKAQVGIIVLDSIAGLVPTSLQDEDFSYSPLAWQARFVNQSLPRLLPYLQEGAALVVINQIRSSLGPVSLDAMPG